MSKPRISLPCIFAILGFILLACGLPGAAAPPPPTPTPKSITVYTGGGEEAWYGQFVTAFNRQHPDIQVNMEAVYAGQIIDRLLSEKTSPKADVIWVMPGTSLLRAAAEGLLEPYAPARLAEVDAKMRDFNDPPLFVGTDVFMSAFCVNTQKLIEHGLPRPNSWQDLTNPVYAEQIVMPDPSFGSTGYMALSAFMQPELFGGEPAGWTYMEALDKNIAWYTKSGLKPCQLAAEGKVAIGISYGAEATRLRGLDYPLEAVFPAEGSGWEVEASALVRKSIIKPEALIFLDWAISDSAMRLYAKNTPVTSISVEAVPLPEGYIAEPTKQLLRISFVWSIANRERLEEAWIQKFGNKSEGRGAEIPDAFN